MINPETQVRLSVSPNTANRINLLPFLYCYGFFSVKPTVEPLLLFIDIKIGDIFLDGYGKVQRSILFRCIDVKSGLGKIPEPPLVSCTASVGGIKQDQFHPRNKGGYRSIPIVRTKGFLKGVFLTLDETSLQKEAIQRPRPIIHRKI